MAILIVLDRILVKKCQILFPKSIYNLCLLLKEEEVTDPGI